MKCVCRDFNAIQISVGNFISFNFENEVKIDKNEQKTEKWFFPPIALFLLHQNWFIIPERDSSENWGDIRYRLIRFKFHLKVRDPISSFSLRNKLLALRKANKKMEWLKLQKQTDAKVLFILGKRKFVRDLFYSFSLNLCQHYFDSSFSLKGTCYF